MSEHRTLIAAVGPVGGSLKILYSDLPLAKSSSEPRELVGRRLIEIGMQPETVAVLCRQTEVAKARRAERTKEAVAKLRAIPGADDDFVLGVLDGSVIGFNGKKGISVFKAARHSVREPGGRFQKANPTTVLDGLSALHSGNVHPAIRRLAAQRGASA